jgi:hypothetical protein
MEIGRGFLKGNDVYYLYSEVIPSQTVHWYALTSLPGGMHFKNGTVFETNLVKM